MKLGNLILPKTAALAPMAGVGDRAFRELCKEFGACYTVAEMASSKGLTYQAKKTDALLVLGEGERPAAVQLFGDDPAIMAKAAVLAMAHNPDAIDLNMGCPAPKVAGNGGGSALMKNPKLAGEIVQAVSRSVPVPVTVKFRKGWDEDLINAVEFACVVAENGAAALTVHGRTRQQMYAPPVDREIIRKVKEAVSIPVIGNGDVVDLASAIEMYEQTGCDLIMVGRGALGSPWLFSQIERYFTTGEILPEPPLAQRLAILRRQMTAACLYKGEFVALREGRKHVAWYLKGLRGAAGLRKKAGSVATMADLDALIGEALALQEESSQIFTCKSQGQPL